MRSRPQAPQPELTGSPLRPDFYLDRPDIVAPRLLGKMLIRQGEEGEVLAGRIVEVEAYFGSDDPAAHAFAGQTPRNSVLFGPPGHAYVYFIYGMHYCLNVSCEPEGQAGCVLIRALEPLSELASMATSRNLPLNGDPRLLTSGPGRLCQAFGITRAEHNGMDVTTANSALQVIDDGSLSPRFVATPRIGIRKASDRPLRFCVEGNSFVTRSPKT